MASTLVFPEDRGQNKGWNSAVINREDVSDERIVRELVQNALDASIDGQPVEVKFHLINVPIGELPHIEEYRKAYELAKETQQDQQSTTGLQIVGRMDAALGESVTQCLVCVDDGEGIDEYAMRKLYGEATTGRPTQGRGSAGLGHLKPFATSVLRYVFYAGRHLTDTKNSKETTEIFGGHTILATQSTRRTNPESGTQYSPDGFVCDDDFPTDYVEEMKLPQQIPALMSTYMPQATGSVVLVTGYAPKYDRPDLSHADLLLGAVAKNFMVAIEQGDLVVSFTDSTDAEETQAICNQAKLEKTILQMAFQRIRREWVSGPPGLVSCGLYETMKHGYQDDGYYKTLTGELDGVQIWLRPLPPDERRTRVAIFREGMWVTDDCPELQASDFGNNANFSCVVNLPTDSNEASLTQLVREAEGTSHLAILPSEINDSKKQELLEMLLISLQKEIAKIAPDHDSDMFVPDELRLFDISTPGRSLPVPRPKAIPTIIDDTPEVDEMEEVETDEEETGEHDEGETTTEKEKVKVRKERPNRGNASGIRSTAQVLNDTKIETAWRADQGFPHGAAGVRVVIPGGSDESSRATAESMYLKIGRIEYTDKNGTQQTVTPVPTPEIHCPDFPSEGRAIITLDSPPPRRDALNLIVVIVHRKTKEENSE